MLKHLRRTLRKLGIEVAEHLSDVVGQGVVLIDATLDGKTYKNHFLYGEPPFDWVKLRGLMGTWNLWGQSRRNRCCLCRIAVRLSKW